KKAEDLSAINDGSVPAKALDANPYLIRQVLRLAYERSANNPQLFANTPKIRRWEDLRRLNAIGAELKFKPAITHGDASLALSWLARFAADRGDLTDAEISAMGGTVVWYPDSTHLTSPAIRREFASAAVRLAGTRNVTPLLHPLMWTPEDATDPIIPHLVWLAYEKVLGSASSAVLDAELAWLVEESYPKGLTPDRG